MKRALLLALFIAGGYAAQAQITITAADMPVAGDTLRSSADITTDMTASLADSGAGMTWSYPLVSASQSIDTYKTAAEVNFVYALTISSGSIGYRLVNGLPIPGGAALPIMISDIYTFFKQVSSPSSFVSNAYAASISGLPTAIRYGTPDTWYFFPLSYGRSDSSGFALTFSLPALGGIKREGYRKSRVDGYGTITTPYFTTPAQCIRIRSEIHETDSVTFDSTTIGIPMVTAEYKWLVNGEHYPALWVTTSIIAGSERVTGTRYRDSYRMADTSSGVASAPAISKFDIYPNPAINGMVNLSLPASWQVFTVAVYDVQSRLIATYYNTRKLDISALPAGQYIIRAASGGEVSYGRVVKR